MLLCNHSDFDFTINLNLPDPPNYWVPLVEHALDLDKTYLDFGGLVGISQIISLKKGEGKKFYNNTENECFPLEY